MLFPLPSRFGIGLARCGAKVGIGQAGPNDLREFSRSPVRAGPARPRVAAVVQLQLLIAGIDLQEDEIILE